jgi:hypothetical protein
LVRGLLLYTWDIFDPALLDGLSRNLAQRLLAKHPDWNRFAEVRQSGDGDSGTVEDPESDVDANVAQRSADLVEEILNEDVVVVVKSRDGRWDGSELVEATKKLSPIRGHLVQVFSWLGTHDRVLQ